MPGGLKFRGYDLEAAISGGLDALLSHALAAHPPLGLQHRLNDVLAAAAEGYAHLVVLGAHQQPLAVQPLYHSLANLPWQTFWCQWQGRRSADGSTAAAESVH